MSENIKITNLSNKSAVIDIEGIIGVAENIQFDDPGVRVATYEKFKSTIEQIRNLKADRLIVNIRSAGGDVNDALLIHDSLLSLDARITTRCYGYIASAATIIAQAASKGRREISSNSLYLIHNSVSRAEGNSGSFSQAVDLLQKTDDRIASIYACRSSKDIESFLTLMSENGGNGRWLSPQEALETGLVDKIINAAPITNVASQQVKDLKLPEIPETIKTIKTMKISNKWKEILALIGLKQEKEVEVNDQLFEVIDNQLSSRAQQIEQLQEYIGDAKSPEEVQNRITQLQDKIVELEAQNLKLRTKATKTLMKEDPVATDNKTSLNQSAYEQDVRNFK